jgi:mRNA interferase MazF
MKDFDAWNKEKKRIQNTEANKMYHEREIWWLSLGLNVGFEQDGTSTEYHRPALILKGFSKSVCLIVPLTTSQKKNPYHVDLGLVDGRQSYAIISQIRLVDTRRFVNKVGMLDKCMFDNVKSAVKAML